MKKTYGIIGYGIVGKATHKSLLKNKTVLIHDLLHNTSLEELASCDTVFFCIPTSSIDDLENLLNEILKLKEINKDCIIVIRSTVPVMFCKYVEETINDTVYYVPEFLRERQWEIDCEKRPLVVGHAADSIPSFLAEEDCYYCSFEEAELLKLFSNTMAASKVVFANHFYDISQKVNADYNKVVDLYKKVEHQDQSYIEVNENLRAFGGKCLPKDLDFVIETIKQIGLNETYFTAMKEDNKQWPTTVRKS
jgi:UDPglucose 6-dehydrogenase